MFRNRYEDVLFDAGDRLLMTFTDDESNEEAFMEWVVPDSYSFTVEEAEKHLSDGWVREANGDITFDYAFDGGLGFLIGGHENIFPDKVRVLAEGEVGINLTGLTPTEVDDLQAGQRIVLGAWQDEYVAEFTLNEYHIEDLEKEDGEIWDAPIDIPVDLTGETFSNTILGVRK